jgi:hypothetical protein
VSIERRRGSRIAQPPQHNAFQPGNLCGEFVDCRTYVGIHFLKPALRSAAVTHPSIVEAHGCNTTLSQESRQEHELSMTTRAVLRAANYDEYRVAYWLLWAGYHPDQSLPLAIERYTPLSE